VPRFDEDIPVRTGERRRSRRGAAAHPVALLDRRGRTLLRARTSNISENGLYCLTIARRALHLRGRVVVEISLPAGPGDRPGDAPSRSVCYKARIVRTEELGQMVGLGIEFLEKLD